MKKRVIPIILTLTMLLGIAIILPLSTSATDVWNGTASTPFSGEGTKDSPYVITSAENLKSLQEQVAAGNNFEGKYIVLANDIDLGNNEWTPIGESTAKAFSGIFDGKGYTISGLSITKFLPSQGLFGCVYTTTKNVAVITNLTVQGNIVMEDDDAFSADASIGGLYAFSDSPNNERRVIIYKCISKVNITINKPTTANKQIFVGGFAGRSIKADLYDCTNEGNVNINYGIADDTKTNTIRVGGFIGMQYNGNYTNCKNYGNVDIVQSIPQRNIEFVGGFMGGSGTTQIHTKITNCANYGNVTTENKINRHCRAGGFIGGFWATTATITNCYNSGNVTAKITGTGTPTDDNVYAGGFTAYVDKEGTTLKITIKDSYNSGTITATGGSNQKAGGIAGLMNTDTTNALNKIENCSTTTSAIIGGGTTTTTDSTVNISLSDFYTIILSIDSAIATGIEYDFNVHIYDPTQIVDTTTATVVTTKKPETTVPVTTTPNTTSATASSTTTQGAKTTKSCTKSSTSFIALFSIIGGVAVFAFTKKKF